MLRKINKYIMKFRIVYLFYIVILNYLFYASINQNTEVLPEAHSTTSIAISSSLVSTFATFDSTNKKVDRQNINEASEHKTINSSKYFYNFSECATNQLNFLYFLQIEDYLVKYKLEYSSPNLRSPPSTLS